MTNNDLQEVYRRRVLEHSREPHNYGRPAEADREAEGFNPLCGDKVTVFLKIKGSQIDEVCFDGSGCAISIASASMMTDILRSKDLTDAQALITSFRGMFKDSVTTTDDRLKEARALEGVRKYPSRVKCATLAWATAEAALNQQQDQVSTE